MKYRWTLDTKARILLQKIVQSEDSETLQEFLRDRPDIASEPSGHVEVSGFERYILNAEFSSITSRLAPGGNEMNFSGSPDHVQPEDAKLLGDIVALHSSLMSASEAFPEQDASFLDNIGSE